jgi:hypothetical protein
VIIILTHRTDDVNDDDDGDDDDHDHDYHDGNNDDLECGLQLYDTM